MNSEILASACLGLVDLIWDTYKPEIKVNYSVRNCIARRLTLLVSHKIHNALNLQDALMLLRDAINTDKEFQLQVFEINKNTINGYNNFFEKYSGRNALFALCIVHSISKNDSDLVKVAKESLLNWYSDDMENTWKSLNGSIVNAFWPFEWFMANFDSISVNLLSNIIYDLTKISISIQHTIKIIKSFFNPYPECLMRLKPEDESIDNFNKRLQETGLFKQYLLLLNLDNQIVKKITNDLATEMIRIFNSFPSEYMSLLNEIIKEPISIKNNINNFDKLTSLNFIKVIECGPNEIKICLLPDLIENSI